MELGGYVITNIEFFYLVIKNMTLIVSNDTIKVSFALEISSLFLFYGKVLINMKIYNLDIFINKNTFIVPKTNFIFFIKSVI